MVAADHLKETSAALKGNLKDAGKDVVSLQQKQSKII